MCAHTRLHGTHSEQTIGLIILPRSTDGNVTAEHLEGVQIRGRERISGKI